MSQSQMSKAQTPKIPPKSQGTLHSFFNGTAKAMEVFVACPVCGSKVKVKRSILLLMLVLLIMANA